MRLRNLARISLLSISLFCVSILASCGKQEVNENNETATSGALTIEADEALKPAVDSLITGFMLENPKAKITAQYVSAGQAVQDLLAQKVRVILVSRFLNKTERDVLAQYKLTLPDYTMAENALGCIVSSKSPLEALAMSDLRGIVRNEIIKWSDLKHSISNSGVANTSTGAKFSVEP